MYVVKKDEARTYLDGPEVCREYVVTGKITFGTSTLQPGQTGAIDPGHPDSHESFYVSRGEVILRNPDTNKHYVLHEGDMLLVEEGEPHELTNIGTELAVISWSCAPSHIV